MQRRMWDVKGHFGTFKVLNYTTFTVYKVSLGVCRRRAGLKAAEAAEDAGIWS